MMIALSITFHRLCLLYGLVALQLGALPSSTSSLLVDANKANYLVPIQQDQRYPSLFHS